MRDRPDEMEISAAMMEAGKLELRERTLGEDLGEVARAVFRAMLVASAQEDREPLRS